MLRVFKTTVSVIRFLEHPKYMFKQIDKEIITFFTDKSFLFLTYGFGYFRDFLYAILGRGPRAFQIGKISVDNP